MPRPALNSDQLLGKWIGYDQDSLLFYRLVLENNKQGSCVVLYNDEFVGAYRIEKWEVVGRDMCVRLAPQSTNAEKMTMSVRFVDESELRIHVKGQERDWQHSLLMHREERTLDNIRKCVDIYRSVFKQ